MLFFKRKLLYPPKMAERADADKMHNAYVQHLKSIKKQLPESAWRLAGLKFHDANVLSVSQPTKRELTITLDGGYWGRGCDFINDRLLSGRYTTPCPSSELGRRGCRRRSLEMLGFMKR